MSKTIGIAGLRTIRNGWLILCLLVFSLVVMAQETNKTAQKDKQNIITDEFSDLRYHLPSEMFMRLNVADHPDKSEQNRVISLLRFEARTAITKGVVILMGDIIGQESIDHQLVNVAQKLPDYGWNTIFFSPMLSYLNHINEQDKQDENTANISDNNEPKEDNQEDSETQSIQTGLNPFMYQSMHLLYSYQEYQEFISQVLVSLEQTLEQQGGYTIVMANGQSATVLSDIIVSQQTINIDALIVKNSYWPNPQINNQIPKKLAEISIPVLDLTSKQDSHWSLHTQKDRVIAAKIHSNALYRQREILSSNAVYFHAENIAKELHNWFHYLGW